MSDDQLSDFPTPLPEYRVLRPAFLDDKRARATVLSVVMIAIAFAVSRITWKTPAPAPVQDATFGQVKIAIVKPPVIPPAPNDAGGSQSMIPLPAVPTPPVVINTPQPNVSFSLPKVTMPNGADFHAPEATSGGHGTNGQGSGTGNGIGAGNDAGISTGALGAFVEALPHDGRHIIGIFPLLKSLQAHTDIHDRPELSMIEWVHYHPETGWVADYPAEHSGDVAQLPALNLQDIYRKSTTTDDDGTRRHEDVTAIVWVSNFATPEGDVVGVKSAMEQLAQIDSSVRLYVIAYGKPYPEVIAYVRKSGGMIFYPDQLSEVQAAVTK
jgi:hypothetical protein